MATSILGKAVKQCPSLLYAALGPWLAWSYLAFGAGVWIDASEANSSAIANVFLASTVGFIITCFLTAKYPYHVTRFFGKPPFFPLIGFVGAGACLAVIIGGPRYLLSVSFPLAVVVSLGGATLTGVCTSLLAARCMQSLSALPPRRILQVVICDILLASAIYFIIVGAPHVLRRALFCLLPFASALLVSADPDGTTATRDDGSNCTKTPTAFSGRLFRRFCIMVTMLTFALSVVRQENFFFVHPNVAQGFTDAAMILRIVMGLALLVCVLNLSQATDLSRPYYGVLLVVVFVPLATAIFSMESGMLRTLIAGFYTFFEMLIFAILARLAAKSGADALVAYGRGWGFLTFGGLVGYLVGTYVPVVVPIENIELVLALVVAVCCIPVPLFIFSNRDFDTFIDECIAEDELDDFDLVSSAAIGGRLDDAPSRDDILEQFARDYSLSSREAEVLSLILRGIRPDEIASTLYLSVNTVRRHTQNIYVKAGVHSRGELFEEFFAKTGYSPYMF